VALQLIGLEKKGNKEGFKIEIGGPESVEDDDNGGIFG